MLMLECDGVMSASGMLRNPALFSGKSVSPFTLTHEYLTLAETYPTARRYIANHIYSILSDWYMLCIIVNNVNMFFLFISIDSVHF